VAYRNTNANNLDCLSSPSQPFSSCSSLHKLIGARNARGKRGDLIFLLTWPAAIYTYKRIGAANTIITALARTTEQSKIRIERGPFLSTCASMGVLRTEWVCQQFDVSPAPSTIRGRVHAFLVLERSPPEDSTHTHKRELYIISQNSLLLAALWLEQVEGMLSGSIVYSTYRWWHTK
jgi:hypothetical protein